MPIINPTSFGSLSNTDVFQWTQQTLIVPNFETSVVWSANGGDKNVYFDLDLPMDFSKYCYEIIIDVYGAMRLNDTTEKSEPFVFYLNDQSSGLEYKLDRIIDTHASDERTASDFSPAPQTSHVYTALDGSIAKILTGIISGDVGTKTSSYIPSNDSQKTATYNRLRMFVDTDEGTYSVYTAGIMLSYRAYAEK